MFTKLSLLTFYTRLSSEKSFLVLVYIGIFIVTGFGIGSITAVLLQCIPLSMIWDPNQPGSCFRVIHFYYANAALNITTDVAILILPMKILWGLHMPVRQRISLCGLFSLGSLYVIPDLSPSFSHQITLVAPYHTSFPTSLPPFSTGTANEVLRACVASIIRLATLKQLLVSTDPTWALVTPLNWSIIELNTCIFIAGAPALKAFFRRYVPTLLGSSKYGSKSRPTHRNSMPLSSISNNKKDAAKWPSSTVAATGPKDNESQEHIYQSYHGILQEVTVTVASERRSQDTQGGRSMNGKPDF